MKRKRKAPALLALGISAALLLASCGKDGDRQDTEPGEIQPLGKQKIICYDVTVSAPYMEDLVSVFNAQSSTTEVEMRYLEDSDYEDEIARVLESGEKPDILWLRQPSKSNRMAEAGGLYDLSDMVTRSSLDTDSPLISSSWMSGFIPCPLSRIYGFYFIIRIFSMSFSWSIRDR